MRQKRCKHCRETFTPERQFQAACSASCAIELARTHREKEAKRARLQARRERRAALERLRSRGDWIKLAQQAFNAFIRERDRDEPCISCGTTKHKRTYTCISGWVASHFRSTGAYPELRFTEDNVHKACVRCNSHLSGNLIPYRERLLDKIGLERVEWLEGPHPPAKWTIDQLREIIATYRRKTRELKEQRKHASEESRDRHVLETRAGSP